MKEWFKTVRYATEANYGIQLTPDMPIWSHIGRYCSFSACRFKVRPSGKTAYEEAFDAVYDSELVEFGEIVFIKEALGKTEVPFAYDHGGQDQEAAGSEVQEHLPGVW